MAQVDNAALRTIPCPPMSSNPLHLDLCGQAELVRQGKISPTELVDLAIGQASTVGTALGAIATPLYDKARAQVREGRLSAGPFHGVPFLLKDLGGESEGDPYGAGMGALRRAGYTSPRDSYLTAKLRAAGLCFIGRTTTPELGIMPVSEPQAWGPARNPWNPEYSPGGSSGGSGAAVAAGVVAAAHASDGGGSIRIPASHCGLVGLKSSRGRCSFGPGMGERWGGFSNEGFVTRSVRDSAALLDIVAGAMPGDPYTAPPPARPFAESLTKGPRLRIGVMTQGPRQQAVDPECAEAAELAARALSTAGHRVEAAFPVALDDPMGIQSFVAIVAAGISRAVESWGQVLGRTLGVDDVEPLTWALVESARSRSVTDYLASIEAMHRYGRAVASWWSDEGFDLLLTPTVAAPPPRVGELAQSKEEPFAPFLKAAPFGAYTSAFNQSGQPAISLPVHLTRAGLPVGAQLVAAYGREDQLLSVAAELEAAGLFVKR